jgi:imidazolonepropionase-like amidohydrolase
MKTALVMVAALAAETVSMPAAHSNVAVCAPSTAHCALSTDSTVVIHAAHALDGRGGRIDEAWIVVRGGRIESVGKTRPTIAGASTIDLGGATLLPGMIDAHVHPGWYVDKAGKRNSNRSTETPAEAFAARAKNLEATLLAGFTTIQSVGGPEDLELRDSTTPNESLARGF